MIEFRKGDIWQSGVQRIVIPVNCLGVMGAGLAKQADKRRPSDSKIYKQDCRRYLRPRKIITANQLIFVATKDDWRNPSKLEWIREGLVNINKLTMECFTIKSVALPFIGCGCGGLRVDEVKPLMVELLQNENCKFVVVDNR